MGLQPAMPSTTSGFGVVLILRACGQCWHEQCLLNTGWFGFAGRYAGLGRRACGFWSRTHLGEGYTLYYADLHF